MKHYTTIEQSKKLVELGLNPDTADMCYIAHSELVGIYEPFCKKIEKDDVPCWSLGALLEVISNYTVYHIGNNKIHITFYSAPRITSTPTYITNDYNSLIDAAFQMICWLLENGYIKKEE